MYILSSKIRKEPDQSIKSIFLQGLKTGMANIWYSLNNKKRVAKDFVQ